MKDYNSFHSMVVKPSIANNCIQSFVQSKGCILFMPYDHGDDKIHRYDASRGERLSLISYYALVFFSFTGLSTLLGMTKTVDVQDYTSSGGLSIWNKDGNAAVETRSILNPQVYVRDCALKYVEKHIKTFNRKIDNSDGGAGSPAPLKLQRRFEYNFRLCGGLNVIMLHLASSDCPDVLHLVEVYQHTNPVLRYIIDKVLSILTICLRGTNKKRK